MTEFLTLETRQRNQLVAITDQLERVLAASGVKEGLLVAQVLHTTAGLTVNENADPDVGHDLLLHLSRLVPRESPGFRHAEGNSDAHLKASLVGSSVSLPVSAGRLVLGTWQGVYFCEFDGPRSRKVAIQILKA